MADGKATRLRRAAARVFPVALLVLLHGCAGCEDRAEDGLRGTVRVDGSSTVFPITEAVAEEFMRDHPGVRVTVGVSGTGGGFAKFVRGETDVNDASRAIKATEARQAAAADIQFIELPVAYDGLAIVVHPDNDWATCLTTDELRRIWEPGSDVRSWQDVRPSFPDRPLKLYGPGTDSGTYDYFTAAVSGKEGASRADFTASEDDNVLVQGIAGDEGSLGYFGLAYFEENESRLKLLSIDAGRGCTEPTSQTVQDGSYQPLARPEFIYVNRASAADSAVAAFVRFYLEYAAPLAEEVGAVPLSDTAYAMVTDRFDRRTTGSLFGGEGGVRVGVRVAEVLAEAQPEAQTVDTSDVRRPANVTAAGAQ